MKEYPNIDLKTLANRFITCDDYTKEVILEELEYRQGLPDFLCLVDGDSFLIGYRNRDSLWISQAHNPNGIRLSKEALAYAEGWAKVRGLTSLTAETDRRQYKAMERYGFTEESVFVKKRI